MMAGESLLFDVLFKVDLSLLELYVFVPQIQELLLLPLQLYILLVNLPFLVRRVVVFVLQLRNAVLVRYTWVK